MFAKYVSNNIAFYNLEGFANKGYEFQKPTTQLMDIFELCNYLEVNPEHIRISMSIVNKCL